MKQHLALKAIAVCFVMILAVSSTAIAGDVKIGKVDAGKFPQVKVIVNSNNQAEEADKIVSLKENGREIKKIAIKSLSQTAEPMAVVLIIDVSGSMKGNPLEEAKIAAGIFIDRMDPKDRVAIIAFNSEPVLMADFTSDKAFLKEAIGKLTAEGATAVYDGVNQALLLMSQSQLSQESIVLLSDGADTSSKTTIEPVIESAKVLGVPVYTIALGLDDLYFAAVSRLSDESGGKFVRAPNADSLSVFYAQLAKDLKNTMQITYRSAARSGRQVRLEVAVEAGDKRLIDSAKFNAPQINMPLAASRSGKMARAIKDQFDYLAVFGLPLIVVLFTLAASLFTYAVIMIFVPDKNILKEQLKIYERLNNTQKAGVDIDEQEGTLKTKVFELVGYLAAKRGFTDFVAKKLEQAGLPVKPREYIFFHFFSVFILGFLAWLASGSIWTPVAFIILGVLVPLIIVGILIKRRQKLFHSQLPDILSMMSGSLKAGYGPLQAVDLVSKEAMPPMSLEFKRVVNQTRLGISLDDALDKMADRVGSETFDWTIMAINVQKEIGGNLAQILEILAETIRQREAVRRQIKALTAEGRLSAIILFALPFVQGFLLFWINPSYMSLLFTHILGWAMMILAFTFMLVGAIWLKSIVNIEV